MTESVQVPRQLMVTLYNLIAEGTFPSAQGKFVHAVMSDIEKLFKEIEEPQLDGKQEDVIPA